MCYTHIWSYDHVDAATQATGGPVNMEALPWQYTAKDGQVHTGKWSFATLVSFLDKDGGGTIDKAEFKKRMQTGKKQFELRGVFGAHGVDWREVFDLIDTDGSGTIDMEELREYLQRGRVVSGNQTSQAVVPEDPTCTQIYGHIVYPYMVI